MQIITDVVPNTKDLLRIIWLDFCNRGVTAEELKEWREQNNPLPHLRMIPEVLAIRYQLEKIVGISHKIPCEPQIIWHLPQSRLYNPPPPHLDTEPPWAEGKRYFIIVGVALTPWRHHNGTMRYWEDDGAGPLEVNLNPGDIVIMDPSVRHASGLNFGTEIRAGVYYRWLNETTV